MAIVSASCCGVFVTLYERALELWVTVHSLACSFGSFFSPVFLPVIANHVAQQCTAGNERFRQLIDKHAPVYLEASTKYQKSEVIAKIVTEVRTNSPDGGFVKKDFYSGRWYEIGDEKARDKVGECNDS